MSSRVMMTPQTAQATPLPGPPYIRSGRRRGKRPPSNASRAFWRRADSSWCAVPVSIQCRERHPCAFGLLLVDEGRDVGYCGAMAYWLLKSEPDEWSWAQQVAQGRQGAEWTGIRNFSAQRNLRTMKKGEQAFFYHTGKERTIVGIVKVIAEVHPDSTDSAWQAIDVVAVRPLPTPVGLDQIKADRRLAGMALARLPRLSVQPVTDAEWRIVCQMGGLGGG
jgi:predicted RNA-binding protein with PUA-like domain